MKAKEYYAKYGELLMNPETQDKALSDLLFDFIGETNEVMMKRKATSNKACLVRIATDLVRMRKSNVLHVGIVRFLKKIRRKYDL